MAAPHFPVGNFCVPKKVLFRSLPGPLGAVHDQGVGAVVVRGRAEVVAVVARGREVAVGTGSEDGVAAQPRAVDLEPDLEVEHGQEAEGDDVHDEQVEQVDVDHSVGGVVSQGRQRQHADGLVLKIAKDLIFFRSYKDEPVHNKIVSEIYPRKRISLQFHGNGGCKIQCISLSIVNFHAEKR